MKVKSEEVVRQNEMMVQKVDKLEQGSETGGEAVGNEYKLCFVDHSTPEPEEQAQVYPADEGE